MAGPWDDYAPSPAPTAAPAKKAQPKPYTRQAAREALRASDAEMNASKKDLTPDQWKKALTTYYASPTIKRLRRDAGLPETFTRKEELASIARAKFKQESTMPVVARKGASADAGPLTRRRQATEAEKQQILETGRLDNRMGLEQSYTNAFGRTLFGIPERIRAAFDSTSGARNYGEKLAVRRQVTDMQRDRNIVGNVGGTVGGAVTSAAGGAGAIRLAGRGIAALPGGQAVGNFLQNLTMLQQGQKAGNAARIVAGGAAGGAAQSAGEGSDVTTGAVTGAIAAPLTVAGFKGLEWATRPARDFLRTSGATGILRRFTSATREEITDAINAFRDRTGREPTVFEVLPAGDRQAVEKLLKKMPDRPREQAADLVSERVRAMPEELASRTEEITAPQQRFMARDLARELAESRGATAPTPDELALARQATTNPTRMEEVRNTVNRNIMAPFDNQPVVQSVDDLVPTAPQNRDGRIVQVESDPDISAMIRRAAGTLRLSNNGITGQNMTNLRAALQDIADRGGNEGLIAQSAITHLDDVLETAAPEIADAAARMRAANTANKTRMQAEAEGRKTRGQEDIPVDSRLAGWRSDAAYESAEGAAGRAAGQRATLVNDFSGTPGQAISRAGEIAESPGVQNAISGNLGAGPGGQVADMAGAQAESFRRLSRLRQPREGESQDIDFGDLAMSMSLLSPTSLVRTKSQAVGTILRFFAGIPEGRATQIVEALFSREPEQMARALRMLDSAGERGSRALRDIVASVAIGGQAGDAINNIDESRAAPTEEIVAEEVPVDEAPQEAGPWDAFAGEEAENSVPYGRAVIEALFPGVEVTDDNRDPNSALGRANPNSYHNTTDGAVDVRPIPGMTFEEFIATLQANGYDIIEAIDEVNNPSGHATGPHWHVVLA